MSIVIGENSVNIIRRLYIVKKSIDVIGLPVFSIIQGKEIGKVKRFVIDPAKGAVIALVIDDGKWYLAAKLLPMSAVTAIGEYAVTVDEMDSLVEVKDIPDVERLLDADIDVIGTKVLTKSGRIRGKVNEIIIDDSGKINFCEIEEQAGEISQIPADIVVTYGKEVLVITDGEGTPVIAQEKTATQNRPTVPAVNVQPPVSTNVPKVSTDETSVSSQTQTETPDESNKKFDDRHRKYLLGKKASRRIETDNGVVIVEQGGEITEEVLQKAKLAGKFVELSMNIQ